MTDVRPGTQSDRDGVERAVREAMAPVQRACARHTGAWTVSWREMLVVM